MHIERHISMIYILYRFYWPIFTPKTKQNHLYFNQAEKYSVWWFSLMMCVSLGFFPSFLLICVYIIHFNKWSEKPWPWSMSHTIDNHKLPRHSISTFKQMNNVFHTFHLFFSFFHFFFLRSDLAGWCFFCLKYFL